MKVCEWCGETIPDGATVCPLCEQPLTGASAAMGPGRGERTSPRENLREINLEAGRPAVDDAMARFRRELEAAKASRVRMLRVIHGKGTNTGSALIRDEFRRFCGYLADRGEVRAVIYGEDIHPTREWRRRYPFLSPWERQDRANAGITLLEL